MLNNLRNIIDKTWSIKFDTVFNHLDKKIHGKLDGKIDTVE